MLIGYSFIGLAAVLTALAVYVRHTIDAIVVSSYTVPIKDLPEAFDGFTILHISDLHAKEFGPGQERLLGVIGRHKFDMIAFTGDVIDHQDPRVGPAVSLIRGLAGKPAFFVSGNHERRTKTDIKEALAAEGVNILENRAQKLERGGQALWIIGVEAPHQRHRMGRALRPIEEAGPRILLAHSPNIFGSAVKAGIDLVLVGHTHGGQVRLPLIGALYAPGQRLFPKYDLGLFSSGDTRMVVSGGLGESWLPIRFGIKPEVVLVRLISAPQP